jgi:hypothetical protein
VLAPLAFGLHWLPLAVAQPLAAAPSQHCLPLCCGAAIIYCCVQVK